MTKYRILYFINHRIELFHSNVHKILLNFTKNCQITLPKEFLKSSHLMTMRKQTRKTKTKHVAILIKCSVTDIFFLLYYQI